MPSIITASTASNTALNFSADTSGVLEIRTGSSPTTAMTIDGSQRVGIGTTSPVQLLTVESTSNVRATIRNSTENTSYASSLDFATGSGSLASTNVVGRIIGLITQADPSTLQSALTFHTNAGDAVGERMRIDSSGNVLINSTSNFASSRLFVNGNITTDWAQVIGLRYNVSGQTNNYYKGMTGLSIADGQARGLHIFNYDADSNVGINFYPNNYAGQTANPAMRILSTGRVLNSSTVSVGNAEPASSGAGITFPATQSASSDANTLDDYEEGTWTPTVAFNGNAVGVTYAQQRGNYTKIGNRVFISMYLRLSNKGSSSGNLAILGLPFTSVNSSDQYNNLAVWINSASGISGSMQGYNAPNSSAINELAFVGTGAQTVVNNGNITNSTDFMVNFSYSI